MKKKALKRQLQLFTVSGKQKAKSAVPVSVIHNKNLLSKIETYKELENLSLKELSIALRIMNRSR